MIKNMKIALQLYSVREDLEKDFNKTLSQVKQMGYEGVEFAGLYGNEPLAIKSILDELGLIPISAHVPLSELTNDPHLCVDTYKTIGCKYIAVPWLEEPDRPGNANYQKVKSDISNIADICLKQGIALLYHNHDFEFVKINGKYALDLLYQQIPALKAEIDTCWVNVAGENPSEYIKKYAGRAPVIHLKDFLLAGHKPMHMYDLIGADNGDNSKSDNFEFRPLGAGQQDIADLVNTSSQAGAGWVVVEQDMPSMGKSALDCARFSIDYLNSLY